MKKLFYLNAFFVGLPFFLCLAGFFHEVYFIWGLLSTILTGLFQVTVSLSMLADNPKNKYLQAYIIGVVCFFIIWLIEIKLFNYSFNNIILVSIPPILAIYFTIVIYKTKD